MSLLKISACVPLALQKLDHKFAHPLRRTIILIIVCQAADRILFLPEGMCIVRQHINKSKQIIHCIKPVSLQHRIGIRIYKSAFGFIYIIVIQSKPNGLIAKQVIIIDRGISKKVRQPFDISLSDIFSLFYSSSLIFS